MKLKINLTRGGKGEAVAGGAEEERGESSNNNKKEKRNSKEKKKTKKDSLTKLPKEKKKDRKAEKDAKAASTTTEDEATKLTSSSKKQLPLLRSSHTKNPVPPSEPETSTSPRGAAVSKWEQALRNEEKSKSPAAAESAPSNHQRFATTTAGATPAAPTSPLDLRDGDLISAEAEAEERRKRRQQRALESYHNRPRIPTSRRAYEAGVGVGPAEAINRHLRGGGEDGPWLMGHLIVPRGEAEGLEVEAGDDWYDQLRSDDEEEIDPEQLLLALTAQQQQEEEEQQEQGQEVETNNKDSPASD